MSNPAVKQYLQDTAAGRIDDINDTTRQYLRDYLAQAYEDGESIDDITEALTDDTNFGFGDARAERIARTEVLGASNFGTLQGYRQSGVVDKKGWMATPGTSGSRDGSNGQADHETLDGKEIGIDEKWVEPVFGDELDHPGDGPPRQSCNCRCSLYAAISDPGEGKAMVLARRKAAHEVSLQRQDHWAGKMRAAAADGLAKQRAAVVKVLREAKR